MRPEDELLLRRLSDLAVRAEKSWSTTYSQFLSLGEQDVFLSGLSRKLSVPWAFLGGVDDAERRLLRFGEDDGADPITVLTIAPRNARFADDLTHRDFLGAVLNLGIDRSCLGDIVVREKQAYVFVLRHMASFIENNLEQVKRTPVKVKEADHLPEGALYQLQDRSLLVSSPRADGVIAHAFDLSRGDAQELFRREKVFVNGRAVTKESYELKEHDLVSVRGFGRFFYEGIRGESRKGRLYVAIRLFA